MSDASDLPDSPPADQPVGRMIAMPADANPEGDIFGGWLLAQMDLAGSSPAFDLARGRCATVAVDSMVFHQPVSVGDEISLYAKVIRTGRVSRLLRARRWRCGRAEATMVRVTEGVFTYVAIDEDRKPRPLPDRE